MKFIIPVHHHVSGDKMKENVTGKICNTHRELKIDLHKKLWCEKLKEHFEGLVIGGDIYMDNINWGGDVIV